MSVPLGYDSKFNKPLTLEDIVSTDDEELLDNIINKMQIEIVREALKCLSPRERKIILLKYGLDSYSRKNNEEIAKIFNCSPSRIEADERHALNKMNILNTQVSQKNPNNPKKLKYKNK